MTLVFSDLIQIKIVEPVIIPDKRYVLSQVNDKLELYDKFNMRTVLKWKISNKKRTLQQAVDYIKEYYGKTKVIISWEMQ